MIRFLKRIFGIYEAAQTHDGNQRHWSRAKSSHPASLNTPVNRRTLRNRSRYEYDNNSYCRGAVDTLVADLIGRGPRLQVHGIDRNLCRLIETSFESWSRASGLNNALRILETSRRRDGEGFIVFSSDLSFIPICRVSLDLRLIEADQIAEPFYTPYLRDDNSDDGIKCDQNGKPIAYSILRAHPSDPRSYGSSWKNDWVPASHVIHWFRPTRAGQLRGIPELTPALELFAQLRRYTLATIRAAETAAMLAGVMETNIPAAEPMIQESPIDYIPLEVGSLLTLPAGWHGSQFKPEQPTTNYPAFVDVLLREIGRCLDIPFGVIAGDSSKYNYSSARLDHQSYEMRRDIDRSEFIRCVINPIFERWYEEFRLAMLQDGIVLPTQFTRTWNFDARPSIDPLKDATTDNLRLMNGTTTLSEIFSARGLDWEEQLIQRRRELDRCRELGLGFSGVEFNPNPIQDKLDGLTMVDQELRASITAQKKTKSKLSIAATLFADDAESELSRTACRIIAYTGDAMNLPLYEYPIVIDVASAKNVIQNVPILHDHKADIDNVIGKTNTITYQNSLIHAEGYIASKLGEKDDSGEYLSDKLLRLYRSGVPLQASVGGDASEMEFIPPKSIAQVNGREYQGPLYVARGFALREISVVVLGADSNTQTIIVGSRTTEVNAMNFEQWLASMGLDAMNLSEDTLAKLRVEFEKFYLDQLEGSQDSTTQVDDQTKMTAQEPPVNDLILDEEKVAQAKRTQARKSSSSLNAIRAEYSNEIKRIDAIRKIASNYSANADDVAKAIENGWSSEKFELFCLRNSRVNVVARNPFNNGLQNIAQVVEAAICQTAGMKRERLEASFSEQVLNESHKRYRGRIGLQESLIELAKANGYSGRPYIRNDNVKDILAALYRPSIAAAGISNVDISNLLSNVANKFLLEGYRSVSDVWRNVARIKSVSDFKQNTSLRLVGYLEFEEVGPDGQIKHGRLADQPFVNQARTYAKLITITRQDIINDDLGALTEVPNELGLGAASKLNKVFWTTFLDNATFFSTSNNNLATSSPLGISGLTNAETKFLEQTKPDGSPLDITPRFLLVPVALANTARALIAPQTELRDNASSAKYSTGNPHAGKDFVVITSPYLSNTTISGSSSSSWYLIADPAQVAVMEVCFVDGNETPVIETADADFDQLGIQMRGYYDFGVAKQDYRGGVKATV